uniref:Retrotransposon Copia-like N-terminal domain-containing protein n=1 Tax=Brassica oleracea var. oleracea TaxID=109376 RepID=A0A0D3DB40_BRAOL
MDPTPGKFEMVKFEGRDDFGLWKYKLLGQLEIQGLGSVLKEEPMATSDEKGDGSEVKDVKVDRKEAEKDIRVKNLLGMCLSDTILRKIMDEPTALGMWKALE